MTRRVEHDADVVLRLKVGELCALLDGIGDSVLEIVNLNVEVHRHLGLVMTLS
jgi:hypothetical protein